MKTREDECRVRASEPEAEDARSRSPQTNTARPARVLAVFCSVRGRVDACALTKTRASLDGDTVTSIPVAADTAVSPPPSSILNQPPISRCTRASRLIMMPHVSVPGVAGLGSIALLHGRRRDTTL